MASSEQGHHHRVSGRGFSDSVDDGGGDVDMGKGAVMLKTGVTVEMVMRVWRMVMVEVMVMMSMKVAVSMTVVGVLLVGIMIAAVVA